MSQTNSVLMSIITKYTKQFVDRISELENENNQLKHRVGSTPSTLKADFDSLTERHTELKISYGEIERENTKLRQDIEQLISQQKSLEADIAQYFAQTFSAFSTKQTDQVRTPNKTCTVQIPSVAPSQKPVHREAKATTKLLNTEYESDSSNSETDDEMPPLVSDSEDETSNFVPRKLRFNVRAGQDQNKSFVQSTNQAGTNTKNGTGAESIKLNLSEILPKENESDDDKDDYETILKQIITEGLMSGLENINRSPHNATQNNTPPKRHRPYYAASKARDSNMKMPQRSQQTTVKSSQTEKAEQNTNNFPFNIMFPHDGQGFNHGGYSFTNTPTTENQNSKQQEVQLVQKILESLFNPPGK